jgi:catechol 2,3-dioxygenase-like lactoylglutathione lyase family enzyme
MPVGLVDHFNIAIAPAQADETLRFYREVLGLKDGFRPDFGPDRPGWWLYAGDHPVLHISLRNVGSTKGPTGSFDHIALRATGLAEMRTHLRKLGIPFEEQRVDDNTVHQIFFHDPNGLRVELDYELSDAEAADAELMPASR